MRVPPGFRVTSFANGLKSPRWLLALPNGDVLVTECYQGRIVLMRDTDHGGKADVKHAFLKDLDLPFGMALQAGYLYVAETNKVVRFPFTAGDDAPSGPGETVVAGIPSRGYRQHWTRNILFEPDGKHFYLTVGSETDKSPEKPPRAAVMRFSADGKEREVWATGLRNPVGMAFNPTTKSLWAVVQERDRLGDDLVPDYLAEIREDAFYGWPFAYLGQNEDPRRKGERPDLVAKATMPDVLFQAHSSSLGLVFYEGKMFPEEYRGDAFVAFHGSWNRSKRTGYKVVRVRFKDGRPVGGYDDFCVGWMLGEDVKEVWGRPVGLLVLADGSLLVVDDGANCVWRIAYSAAQGN